MYNNKKGREDGLWFVAANIASFFDDILSLMKNFKVSYYIRIIYLKTGDWQSAAMLTYCLSDLIQF